MHPFLGKRDKLAHYIHDVGTVQYLFYILFFYHILGILNPMDDGCFFFKGEIVDAVACQFGHNDNQAPHEQPIIVRSYLIDNGKVRAPSHLV